MALQVVKILAGLPRAGDNPNPLGRPASIFTTWSANYIEFILASAAPENRANLLKYLATGAGFILTTALAGIRGVEYVGFKSPLSLFNIIRKGQLPIAGITGRLEILKPSTWMPQAIRDIQKGMEGDLGDVLFYTFREEE